MWKMPRCKIVSIMYIMFENFSKFFAEKKNTHIFIAALVILGGIFTLKSVGLYEGLENQDTGSMETNPDVTKTTGTVKRQ
jgi:hypothetical protein